jgi:manganese oxidase
MRARTRCTSALVGAALLLAGCSTAGDVDDAADHTTHVSDGVAAAATDDSTGTGVVRKYFIAADEVEWDYAPSGENAITGEAFGEDELVFVGDAPDRIGSVYTKSLYREYTDDTFTTLVDHGEEWEHLGFLGPVMHAEVGDSFEVVFKNNTRFGASIHPHGVFYTKQHEGAPYDDGIAAADKPGNEVEPGATHTYRWEVPERAGPGPMDGSSVMWMYHSHVDEIADTYAGLMGAMIVTAKGKADADGKPADVDREFVLQFQVQDENASLWTTHNIEEKVDDIAAIADDEEGFEESNLMHSINGYVYGDLPGLTMKQGENVRWYLMGMGTEVDLHTPHWHANTVTALGMRTDVVSLLPASMVIADMQPDNPGEWLFHCHVNDHITAGMITTYTVEV